MESLPHRHLTTLTLTVDFAGVTPVGQTPLGHRLIATVTGGSFAGERLSGTVIGGHDWVINRADGVMVIDVRLTLKTSDGATIYLTYQGNMIATAEALQRFRRGEAMDPADYRLRTVARFECGDERYRWLNDAIVVAVGEQSPTGPVYHLFEIG